MSILEKHVIDYVEGADTYSFFFLAPPEHYAGIETETGVQKLAADSELQDMPVTNTDELALSPVASRQNLRVKQSSGKNKYHSILIASALLGTAQTTLTGKTYKGGTITRVMDSRKKSNF